MGPVDVAVVGAGVAGTAIADAVQAARPDWVVALLERTGRIGGRLHSVAVPGVEHKIELGGMRFLTSHRRVARVVDELGLTIHPFDRTDGSERSLLRGRLANGPGDPAAGGAYDLAPSERGRSALDLTASAFRTILPGAGTLTAEAYAERRARARFRNRRLVDWSIEEALGTILSADAVRFVRDAFGYDSGVGPFNVGDAVEFLLGGGDPTAEARTPDDGMDALPRSLAARFVDRGGDLRLAAQVDRIERNASSGYRLVLADRSVVAASRVALTVPVPALERLMGTSPTIDTAAMRRIIASLNPVPAMKLYLWYERPWWRPSIAGLRDTTDLPIRKAFYLDTAPDAAAAMLAMYTDGRHVDPWRIPAAEVTGGRPAPAALLAQVEQNLRMLHPELTDLPTPLGSAFMHWGADPWQLGWTFWRSGDVSDEICRLAAQPDSAQPMYLAGEAFSRAQSWVEGALESSERVVERLLS